MATLTKGHTFASGDTVTATKLNDLVDSATISAIQTADISDNQITTAKIVDANVTDAKLATGAVTGAAGGGKLAASAINSQTVIADPLAAGDEFLVYDDSATALRKVAFSAFQPAGSIVQIQTSTDGLSGESQKTFSQTGVGADGKRYASGTAAPPNDEGIEIATVTITPKYNDSKILIEGVVPGFSASGAEEIIVALYKDSDATGFAGSVIYVASSGYYDSFTIKATNLPATTSAVTYKMRIGPLASNDSLNMNGYSSYDLGNTMTVLLTATEIKA